MERTNELFRSMQVYDPAITASSSTSSNYTCAISQKEPSVFLRQALRASSSLEGCEAILTKILKLTNRKEFSNDPAVELGEMSEVFQTKILYVQSALDSLKKQVDGPSNNQLQLQQQHYKLVLQSMTKRLAECLEAFKNAVKVRVEHLKQRQQRVDKKYGQGLEQLRASSTVNSTNKSYAMFSPPTLNKPTTMTNNMNNNNNGYNKQQELRRRTGKDLDVPFVDDSYNKNDKNKNVRHNAPNQPAFLQQSQLQQPMTSRDRLRGAQKVEATIAQMGQLFTQMASLVLEQGETISRIEDDVEIGIQNTMDAHKSMTSFYDITKGNRSMIIKVFLLLIFFIFLFIVWT